MSKSLRFWINRITRNRALLTFFFITLFLVGMVLLGGIQNTGGDLQEINPIGEGTRPLPTQTLEMTQEIKPSQKLPFDRLIIDAVENQKQGNVRTEDAFPAQELVFTDVKSWEIFWI